MGFAPLLTAHKAFGVRITAYSESLKETSSRLYTGVPFHLTVTKIPARFSTGLVISR
jgi:hypothetical protein